MPKILNGNPNGLTVGLLMSFTTIINYNKSTLRSTSAEGGFLHDYILIENHISEQTSDANSTGSSIVMPPIRRASL